MFSVKMAQSPDNWPRDETSSSIGSCLGVGHIKIHMIGEAIEVEEPQKISDCGAIQQLDEPTS